MHALNLFCSFHIELFQRTSLHGLSKLKWGSSETSSLSHVSFEPKSYCPDIRVPLINSLPSLSFFIQSAVQYYRNPCRSRCVCLSMVSLRTLTDRHAVPCIKDSVALVLAPRFNQSRMRLLLKRLLKFETTQAGAADSVQ